MAGLLISADFSKSSAENVDLSREEQLASFLLIGRICQSLSFTLLLFPFKSANRFAFVIREIQVLSR